MALPRPTFHNTDSDRQAIGLAFDMIEHCQNVIPQYVTANKPAASAVMPGTIIFVSDGGAGAVFQGSTGAAWVNLG